MIRLRSLTILASAVAIGASAMGMLPSSHAMRAGAANNPVIITMNDKAPFFQPEKVTVKVGEPVEWVNDGTNIHSVSTTAAYAQNPKDVKLPKVGDVFDSGFVPPGGTYTHAFSVPGTYRYFCMPHEKAGMVGALIVKE